MKITRRHLGTIAAASLATPALAQMPKAEVKDKLVVYTGTGLQTILFDELVEPFAEYTRKKYGVAVRVQNVVGPIPALWTKFKTEWPNPSGDIYQLYNENVREGMAKGFFLPLKPAFGEAEWARFDPDALKSMDAGDYACLLYTSPSPRD